MSWHVSPVEFLLQAWPAAVGEAEVGDELIDVVDVFLVAGAGGEGAHSGQAPGGVAVTPGVGVGEVALDDPGVDRECGRWVDGLVCGGQRSPGVGVVGVQVQVVGELPGTSRVAQGAQHKADGVPRLLREPVDDVSSMSAQARPATVAASCSWAAVESVGHRSNTERRAARMSSASYRGCWSSRDTHRSAHS